MLLPCLAISADNEPPPSLRLNDPQPTTILVRVVGHGAMVLGREVGGARITITDVATTRILATGIQQGEAGDQNQIMRTPRLMEEPHYSSRPAAAFTATLDLLRPTLVEVTAEGPLAYPASSQRASTTVWLIPGHDMINDGVVLHLYGYIVQIEHPKPGEPLIAKDDVILRASVRTLSGALVRPHGDWDSTEDPHLRRGDGWRAGARTTPVVLQSRPRQLRSPIFRSPSERCTGRNHASRRGSRPL